MDRTIGSKYNSNPGFLDAPPLSLSRNKIIWIFEGENITKKTGKATQ